MPAVCVLFLRKITFFRKKLAMSVGFRYNDPALVLREQKCEVSSVVEHILHTDGVISSNLILRIPENLAEMQGFFVLKATK